MKNLHFLLIVFAGVFCFSCADQSGSLYQNSGPESASEQQDDKQALPEKGGGGGGGLKDDISVQEADETSFAAEDVRERKIVRNANLRIESRTPAETQKKIVDIANASGGFVLESNSSTSGDQVRNQNQYSIILQVPSDKFETALGQIRKSGVRVLSETVKGQDVTAEFVDVEARLRTKKALEARFLEIMKRANTVKDALEVERELEGVRSEIERIEGRKRVLINLTSLSKVVVNVIPPSAISASSTGFWYQLQDAISDGFEGALTFVLIFVRVLIALIPFLLIIVLPVLLLLRFLWRRYKLNRQARAAAAEVEKMTDDIE